MPSLLRGALCAVLVAVTACGDDSASRQRDNTAGLGGVGSMGSATDDGSSGGQRTESKGEGVRADQGTELPGIDELSATVRILPLGDSLTFGTSPDFSGVLVNLDGGYRILLRELLVNAGYHVDYVGTQANGPWDFDREHEGFPGATIAQISQHWSDAEGEVEPDIVLLLAGTNDQLGVTGDQPPGPASEALGELIELIDHDHPGVQIVVAKPILLGMGPLVGAENPERMREYADLVPLVVESRRAAGLHVHLADLSSVDTGLLGDGVHPSTWEGYEDMARLWYPSVVEAIEATHERR